MRFFAYKKLLQHLNSDNSPFNRRAPKKYYKKVNPILIKIYS